MTKLMEKAIEALRQLPESVQNDMALEVLWRLEEEAEWDTLVASPSSQMWLEKAAQQAKQAHRLGKTRPIDPSDVIQKLDSRRSD